MIINFLYCIDFPQKKDNLKESNRIEGWLLCSQIIKDMQISETSDHNYTLSYGLPRPDVALHFNDFPDNDKCGFAIIAENEPIHLSNAIHINLVVCAADGTSKNLIMSINPDSSSIQSFDVDEDQSPSDIVYQEIEKRFLNTLQKHPWITVRMDITNKCNLRCIMCHYKEKEIHSQPARIMTAERLKYLLQDIAPFVSNIMLSCGFEPLMSRHFSEIVSMINENYPHMEIDLCTNAMLMDSKVRKVIIEKNVTHVLLSFDGVTRQTIEKIRVGADYNKIIGNIKALRDLKINFKRTFPIFFMDFVLMNSNIHEAPAFVRLCSELGIDTIDFRHLVGNIFFSEHEEMLNHNKEKYNYYRDLIIAEGKKYNINVRLPEPYDAEVTWVPESVPEVDLSDFTSVVADEQTAEVVNSKETVHNNGKESDFPFLAPASCLRPFSEIMIIDQEKILPCSYYNEAMGMLDENNTLYSIFFGEKYQKVRKKMLLSQFDRSCHNCPIKLNLLPTEIVR
jgi:MoaA/NifB/PqqE/SkfB family radical SAM enzyme